MQVTRLNGSSGHVFVHGMFSVATAWFSDNDNLAGDNSSVHNMIIMSSATCFILDTCKLPLCFVFPCCFDACCPNIHHLCLPGGAGRGGKEGDVSSSGGVGNRSQGGGSRARPLQEGHPRAQEEARQVEPRHLIKAYVSVHTCLSPVSRLTEQHGHIVSLQWFFDTFMINRW